MTSTYEPLLRVVNLYYRQPTTLLSRIFRVDYLLKDINFTLNEGESLAIIGDEGSGKSELIANIAGLKNPTKGYILYGGQTYQSNPSNRSLNYRMIFQDQETALNRKLKVKELLQIPLLINTKMNEQERIERVMDTLNLVDLPETIANSYPSELSYGQLKRISFARALILNPKVVLADRSISSFDPNLRAHICNMMLRLQKERKISTIISTSDIEIAKNISDKILVLHKGEVKEFGTTKKILENPQNEITQRLLLNYNNEYRYHQVAK